MSVQHQPTKMVSVFSRNFTFSSPFRTGEFSSQVMFVTVSRLQSRWIRVGSLACHCPACIASKIWHRAHHVSVWRPNTEFAVVKLDWWRTQLNCPGRRSTGTDRRSWFVVRSLEKWKPLCRVTGKHAELGKIRCDHQSRSVRDDHLLDHPLLAVSLILVSFIMVVLLLNRFQSLENARDLRSVRGVNSHCCASRVHFNDGPWIV